MYLGITFARWTPLFSVIARMSKVTWAHSMRTFHAHITHICLGNWDMLPPWKFLKLYTLRLLLRPFWPQIPLFQSYLYAPSTSTWKQSHMLRTDNSFPHYFYAGTSEFYVGTGPGMPGCSYTTATLDLKNHETMPALSNLMPTPLSEKLRRGLVTRPYSALSQRNSISHGNTC